jgi:hypothetical protein
MKTLIIISLVLYFVTMILLICAAVRLFKLAARIERELDKSNLPLSIYPEGETPEEAIQKEFGADDPMFQLLGKKDYAQAEKEADADLSMRMMEQSLEVSVEFMKIIELRKKLKEIERKRIIEMLKEEE